jgi:hypothetical protein
MDRNVSARSIGSERRRKRTEELRLPEQLSENYDGPASRKDSVEVSAPGTSSSDGSCETMSDKR